MTFYEGRPGEAKFRKLKVQLQIPKTRVIPMPFPTDQFEKTMKTLKGSKVRNKRE